MDYNETLKYINNTPKFSKILGNSDLLKVLAKFDNPQDKLKVIHVAGTNGKGSVCAMTAKILEEAGFRVGLYTSPFIEVFNERIKINGEMISDTDLSQIATEVKEQIDTSGVEISVFAQITAMAFLYFYRQKCDYVVLETGLGGRLDASNVIKMPIITAITKIGLDHTEYLGDTLAKIAEEKCGIIKDNIPVITTLMQEDEALSVIKKYAKKHNAELYIEEKSDCFLSLSGEYQKENAGISVRIAKLLGIKDEIIKNGLSKTMWPARFEWLSDNVVLDGAHNPDGVSALIESLKKLNRDVIFVVCMMEDKDLSKNAHLISDFAKKVIVTEIDIPRCKKAEALAEHFDNPIVNEKLENAIKEALLIAENDDIVCICGSLYACGEIRKIFLAN